MVRLILVRHGETDWNKARRVQGGNSDTLLNDAGKEQAEAVALRLKQERVQAVYSSPLQRALHTAEAIARYHHLEVKVEPALRELNVGGLEGVSVGLISKRLDELLTMPVRDEIHVETGEGVWKRLQDIGGESLDDLQQRAWEAVQRIVNRHPESAVVLVSHYFVILGIICAVLNLPVSQIGRFRLAAGSISMVVFEERRIYLAGFSDICHLANPG